MNNDEYTEEVSQEENEELRRRVDERHKRSVELHEKANIKKAKAAKRKKNLIIFFKAFLAVIVVLSILFIAAKSLGNMTFTGGLNYISDKLSSLKSGEGYPLSLGSAEAVEMTVSDGRLAVLTDDSVKLLNSTAKLLFEKTHSYASPSIHTGGNRVLVTDGVTGRYMVLSTGSTVYEGQLDARIFAAGISKKGCYSIAVSTSSASSSLITFSAENKRLFEFKCANEYIVGTAVSPNGKIVAAIAVGSKDTKLYSMLYIIDIESQKLISEFRYDNTTLTNVEFSENKTVVVVGTNVYNVIFNLTEQQEPHDFGNNSIVRFAKNGSGQTALVLSKFGSVNSYTLAVLDSKGVELFSNNSEQPVELVACDSKTVSILTNDNKIISFDFSGKQLGTSDIGQNCRKIAISGNSVYALCYGSIYRFPVSAKAE